MCVISAVLDLETGGGELGATFERQRSEPCDIARRPEPEHVRNPARREGAESLQDGVEGRCTICDRLHYPECGVGSVLVQRSEEMDRQVERLGMGPANVRDARLELALEPPRRRKCRLSERDGEEAPHHVSDIGPARALPGCKRRCTNDQQCRTDGDQTAFRPG